MIINPYDHEDAFKEANLCAGRKTKLADSLMFAESLNECQEKHQRFFDAFIEGVDYGRNNPKAVETNLGQEPTERTETMKIDPRKYDLREAKVGTEVTTSKGFTFQLVEREGGKESWKDVTSGLIWHDKEDWSGNYFEAIKEFGDKLPTKKEFEDAEKHGIREVFDDFKNYWFWSQTVHPKSADVAYYFNGNNGDVYYYYRDDSNYYDSARCVGR